MARGSDVAVCGAVTTGVIARPAICVGVGWSDGDVGHGVSAAVASGMAWTAVVGAGVSACAASRVASTRTIFGAAGQPLTATSRGTVSMITAISGPSDGIHAGRRGRRRGGGGATSVKSLENGDGPSWPRLARTASDYPTRRGRTSHTGSVRLVEIRAIRDESARQLRIIIGLSNIDRSPEDRPEFRAVRQIESRTRNERRPPDGRRSSIVAAKRCAQ